MGSASQDNLSANAVPFPFCAPVLRWSKAGRISLNTMGQKKRIGTRQIGPQIFGFYQSLPSSVIRMPCPHQAMRNFGIWFFRYAGQCAHHKFLTDANAKPASNQFVQHKSVLPMKTIPSLKNKSVFLCKLTSGNGAQLTNPVGQRFVDLPSCFGKD